MKYLKMLMIYDSRLLRKNKVILLLCLIALILSIVAILSVQLVNDLFNDSIEKEIALRNGGDIQVYSEKTSLSTDQLSYLDELADNNIDIVLFSKEPVNIFTESRIENAVLNKSLFLKNESSSSDGFNQKVILDSNLAQRLNTKVGDFVSIKDQGKIEDYYVSDISKKKGGVTTADYEIELSEDILGRANITLPVNKLNQENFNGALIRLTGDAELTVEILKKDLGIVLGKNFTVRSSQDLFNNIENRIQLQVNGLNFISIIANIICGMSISFTFIVINMKREKDLAIFKVLGMNKTHLVGLVIIEALLIGLVSSLIAVPLGIYSFKYVSGQLLGINPEINGAVVLNVFRTILFILTGMIAFSIIPADIVTGIPLTKVFRDQKIDTDKQFRIFRSLFVVLILMCIISSATLKSTLGVVFTVTFSLLLFVFYGLLITIYKVISLTGKLFKNPVYLTFASLNANKKRTALASINYIAGLGIILLFINMGVNLMDNKQKNGRGENEDSIVLEIQQKDQKNVENIISELDIKEIEKYYVATGSLETINDTSIAEMIESRFYRSDELRQDYTGYVENLKLYLVDSDLQRSDFNLVQGKGFQNVEENQVIINSELLNQLHLFKEGEKISLNINGKNEEFSLVGINENDGLDAFAYIRMHDETFIDNESHSAIIYSINGDGNKLIRILEENTSAYIWNISRLNQYINNFINTFSSSFIYLALLTILSGLFFLINGNYISILKKKREMSILYVLGSDTWELRQIYLFEGLVIGCLNTALALLISNGVSKFFIEAITQKDYIFNIPINFGSFIFSVLIVLLVYWFTLNRFDITKISSVLREDS